MLAVPAPAIDAVALRWLGRQTPVHCVNRGVRDMNGFIGLLDTTHRPGKQLTKPQQVSLEFELP